MADTGAMKIGILQCDSVPAELQPEFGDYPDMFRYLLTKADPRLDFAVYDLVHEEMPPDLNACDAWLFTGSKCGANDDSAWIRHAGELVRSLHAQRRPTVGICFGHQLIARTLGGRVERARDWGVGVHTTQLLRQRPWMQPARHELSLLVSHQDQVVELPPDAVHLASHPFCPNDMYQIGQHIFTCQGHPEFPKGYARTVMRRRRERIGERIFREGMASLEQATDGDVAAAWIVAFLRAAVA